MSHKSKVFLGHPKRATMTLVIMDVEGHKTEVFFDEPIRNNEAPVLTSTRADLITFLVEKILEEGYQNGR